MNTVLVFPCGLTFELSGPRRIGAWPARWMMNDNASRAECQAGGGPLERRVRHHRVPPAHRTCAWLKLIAIVL